MAHRDDPNRSSPQQYGIKDRSRLAALESTRLLDTPFEERFDALTRLACRLFEVPIALIGLVDEKRVWFKSISGLTVRETQVEHSFCAHALNRDTVMVIEDARNDPCFADNPLVTGPPHIRFYAGAPIHGPDNLPLGTFCIISDRPRTLSNKERDTLQSLARLTTLEIAHRQHQPELLIPDSEEALIQSIGTLINRAEQRHIAGTPPRLVLFELLDDLLRLAECEYGLVGEIDRSGESPYLDVLGMSLGDVTPQAQEFFAYAGRRLNLERMNALVGGRLLLPEIQIFSEDDLARMNHHDLPANHPALRNALMVPFMNDGRIVGMLLMANRRTHFNPERARRLLKPLIHIGSSLLASLHAESEKAALHATLEEFRATLDATLDLILIFDEQSQRITYCNQGALEQLGYSEEALLAMSPTMLLDSLRASELAELLAPLRNQQQRLVRLNATLRRRDNEPLPVQAVVQRIRHDDSDRTNYIIVARDLREILEAQREIDWITHHDSLTRQLNRVGFLQALMLNAPRQDDPTPLQMVMVCGIDRFKRLNDAHGTALADTILCELTQRLTHALGSYPDALLGRLSGDEFAISVNIAQHSNAILLADWLRQQVEQHRFEAVEDLQLTVSIGVAMACRGQTTAEELLRRANAALVRAKRQGRNRVRQYLSSMLDEASRHQSIERRLSGAFARGDFTLHFQSQWALCNLSRPIGAETLLRWEDEELGVVSPDVFIPILEESGMMVEVGRWIIDQALDHLVVVHQQLPEGFFVSVNVSAIQLMDDAQLADHVVSALHWRGLPATALELEITETALIQSPHWVGQQLEALHERGVNIALDDFGTGFSSLSHLKQFPFDTVKIDRSFIAGLPNSAKDRAIIESLLTLCRGFGRDVCAEGIETPAQLDFLRRLNCARAQGYLLARPGPSLQAIVGDKSAR